MGFFGLLGLFWAFSKPLPSLFWRLGAFSGPFRSFWGFQPFLGLGLFWLLVVTAFSGCVLGFVRASEPLPSLFWAWNPFSGPLPSLFWAFGAFLGLFRASGLLWAFLGFWASGPLLGLFEVCGLLPGLFPAFSWPRSLFCASPPSLFWASPFLAFFSPLLGLLWASSQPFLGLGACSGPFLGFWTWTSSQPFLGPSKPFLGAFLGLGPLLGLLWASGPLASLFWASGPFLGGL